MLGLKGSEEYFLSSSLDVKNEHKPGGTALLFNSKLMDTIKKYGVDTYGRWVWTRIRRKKKTDLLLVQIYVSQEKYGLFTSATQQLLQLMENEKEEITIKHAFRRDLKKLISSHDCEHIVIGDFNSPLEDSVIQHLLQDNELVDITTDYQTEGSYPFATYIRFKKKSITP